MAYIQHRLTKASLHGSTVFTQRALRKIIAHAHGIPRLLNVYCDNALITGFGYQKDRITAGIAKEVIADFQKKRTSLSLKLGFAATALLLLGSIFSVFLYGGNVFSKLEVVPKFSEQEKHIAHKADNTGSPQTGQVAAIQVQSEPIIIKETTEAKKEPVPIIRTVRKGDNLSKLVREIYSYNDEKLINLVMQNNPGIRSSDKILTGDEIIFPAQKPFREDNE